VVEPADYPRTQALDIGREVNSDDIIRHFVDFMENDRVGTIANMHLQLADLKSTHSVECKKLAEMASTAVDYPKTGIKVNMEERPKFKSSIKPDFMAHGPRIYIDHNLDLELDENEPDDGTDAFAALDQDERKITYYESENALGQLYRAINDRKFYRSIETRSKVKKQHDRTATSPLLKSALAMVLQKAQGIEWRHHLQTAKHIRNIYESFVDNTRCEFAFRQTKPLNELEVVSGIILGANTRIVQQTTLDMKDSLDRHLAYILALINGSDGEEGSTGDGQSLARSIACFDQAVERPSNVKSDADLISWKYFAASVCLRQLSMAGLLKEEPPIPVFSSGFVPVGGM
jgi:hypothetical protein